MVTKTVEATEVVEREVEREVVCCDRDGCNLTSDDDVEFATLYSGGHVRSVVNLRLEAKEAHSFDGMVYDSRKEAEEHVESLYLTEETSVRKSDRFSQLGSDVKTVYEFSSHEKVEDVSADAEVDICERCLASLFTDLDPGGVDIGGAYVDREGGVRVVEEKNPLISVDIGDNVLFLCVLLQAILLGCVLLL